LVTWIGKIEILKIPCLPAGRLKRVQDDKKGLLKTKNPQLVRITWQCPTWFLDLGSPPIEFMIVEIFQMSTYFSHPVEVGGIGPPDTWVATQRPPPGYPHGIFSIQNEDKKIIKKI
jgi:hypothetical protein